MAVPPGPMAMPGSANEKALAAGDGRVTTCHWKAALAWLSDVTALPAATMNPINSRSRRRSTGASLRSSDFIVELLPSASHATGRTLRLEPGISVQSVQESSSGVDCDPATPTVRVGTAHH